MLRRKHMIRHFTECVHLTATAALSHFPGNFRRLLQNVARALQSRGHQADHIAQSALAVRRLVIDPHGRLALRRLVDWT